MRSLIKVFKALSDTNRIRIIKMLEIRPLCVCEITEVLQLANSTVSKHLSILRDAELILDEKDGKWVNYRLNTNLKDFYKEQVLALINSGLQSDDKVKQDAEKVKTVDRKMICGL